MDAGSSGNPKVTELTTGSATWRFAPVWSPDSTKLVFSDKNQRIQYLDINTRKVTQVDTARRSDITDYGWSPDSKWITYTKEADNGQGALWVYSLDRGKTLQLTDGSFNDFSPVFSRDAKYLYFCPTGASTSIFPDLSSPMFITSQPESMPWP